MIASASKDIICLILVFMPAGSRLLLRNLLRNCLRLAARRLPLGNMAATNTLDGIDEALAGQFLRSWTHHQSILNFFSI